VLRQKLIQVSPPCFSLAKAVFYGLNSSNQFTLGDVAWTKVDAILGRGLG